uniref:Terminase small subunit n=1 Tax=Siphoviridae sp. ctP6113 TaxID=2826318 RepID=A0A8S5MUB8_9CAUD|nr:MAG TPA: terminase small subunit [Siphoviridae sp. ctP6113]
MGRPAKSVKVKAGAIASEDAAVRSSVEDKLRGEAVKPDPPEGLTPEQRKIFQFIVDGLAAGEILGKMDVFVLESTAIAVDRLRAINNMIDENPQLIINTALQNSRAKYQSDLWRGCSELCLSPQARAKLGGMAAQKAKEKKDPLIEALHGDD